MLNRGPSTPGFRMLNRCQRHSPAWQAHRADLVAEFLEAWRHPGPLVVLPPGGRPPTDEQRRWCQRGDPTGRMREQVRRQLLAAGTPRSVIAATEAVYRPRRVTYRLAGDHLVPVGEELSEPEVRRRALCSPTGRMRRHARKSLLCALRSDGSYEGVIMVETCRAYAVLPWAIGIAPHCSRLGSGPGKTGTE